MGLGGVFSGFPGGTSQCLSLVLWLTRVGHVWALCPSMGLLWEGPLGSLLWIAARGYSFKQPWTPEATLYSMVWSPLKSVLSAQAGSCSLGSWAEIFHRTSYLVLLSAGIEPGTFCTPCGCSATEPRPLLPWLNHMAPFCDLLPSVNSITSQTFLF